MVRTPASTAVGAGSIPGWGANIPHLLACSMARNTLNLALYDAPKSNPGK